MILDEQYIAHQDAEIRRLLEALQKAHDTLDAICMAGYMDLVSAALPDGFGLDTIRSLLQRKKEDRAMAEHDPADMERHARCRPTDPKEQR